MKRDNEIIAEFMVLPKVRIGRWQVNGCAYLTSQLQYKNSWDWLMPVVWRIEVICSESSDMRSDWREIFNGTINTNIKVSFDVVVEFIRWYNSQLIPQSLAIQNAKQQ